MIYVNSYLNQKDKQVMENKKENISFSLQVIKLNIAMNLIMIMNVLLLEMVEIVAFIISMINLVALVILCY